MIEVIKTSISYEGAAAKLTLILLVDAEPDLSVLAISAYTCCFELESNNWTITSSVPNEWVISAYKLDVKFESETSIVACTDLAAKLSGLTAFALLVPVCTSAAEAIDNWVLFVVIDPPNETDVPSIVIALLASFAFAIEPAKCTLSTEPSVMCSELIASSAILAPVIASASIWAVSTVSNKASAPVAVPLIVIASASKVPSTSTFPDISNEAAINWSTCKSS